MNSRTRKGGALALVVVSTLVVASLGIAFFFLVKFFGGHRELQNAADSGSLSVANVGVEHPTVDSKDLNRGKRSPFEGLMDAGTHGINLQTYNRAVGQAYLVALNAEAEQTAEGIKNARDLIQSLQGPNGIGHQLSDLLSSPDVKKNWVENSFMPSAASNSLRMLSDNSSTQELQYKTSSQTYRTSYVRPGSQMQTSSSNIALGSNFDKQIPFDNYIVGKTVKVPANTKAYDQQNKFQSLRGYEPIKVEHVGSLCAVTMSPYDQAHLVSNHDIEKYKLSPGASVGLVVPPNSFQMNCESTDNRSKIKVTVQSASGVGTKSIDIPLSPADPNLLQLSAAMPKYDIAIPRGYLIIDNMGDGKDSSYFGRLPQANTKAAPWYSTTGVSVDFPGSGCFSNVNGLLEDWMKYNLALTHGGTTNLQQPTLNGLFNSAGHPASRDDAAKITPSNAPSSCNCNDLNSDAEGKNPNSTCVSYARSTIGNPGPFDTAYYPNYLNPPQYGKGGAQLTAGELAKMKLWELYLSDGGFGGLYFGPSRSTGARIYPHAPEYRQNDPLFNQPAPYNALPGTNFTMGENVSSVALSYSSPDTPGQISRDGSMMELMEQIGSHSVRPFAAEELKRFLVNRLYQIKPDASADDLEEVLRLKTLEVRKKYYIYLNSKRNFVVSTTRPFWLDGNDPLPDGKPRIYTSNKYDLVGTLVNSPADFNIHAIPFWDYPTPNLMAGFMTATFTPSSGADNLLGVVKFSDNTLCYPVKFTNAN